MTQICTMIPVAKEVGSLRAIASGGIAARLAIPNCRRTKKKHSAGNWFCALLKLCNKKSESHCD